jgi:predicted nuclease of predicted toxin-antitoxin system
MKSKKRSGASSKQKPPESPTLFLDRSLGKKTVAEALRGVGVKVEVHDDHFPQDATDETWLTEVGKSKWIVLTKDRRIRFRAIERTALINAGVRAFVLTAGDIDGAAMAAVFVKALPKMLRFSAKHAPPFIATISKTGSVTMLQQLTN